MSATVCPVLMSTDNQIKTLVIAEQPFKQTVSFVTADAMQSALASADFAISRAGAMSLAELCAWGVPMILVPLPTAAADHQTANARTLEAAGFFVRPYYTAVPSFGLWGYALARSSAFARS